MSANLRAGVAAFDAVAMSIYAYLQTGGFGNPGIDLMLWGSAAPAAIAAFVGAANGAAVPGWVAIRYIPFAGLLLTTAPQILLVAPPVPLTPLLQPPVTPPPF